MLDSEEIEEEKEDDNEEEFLQPIDIENYTNEDQQKYEEMQREKHKKNFAKLYDGNINKSEPF